MFRNARFTAEGRVRLLAATTLLCLLAGASTRLAHDLDERGRALAKVDALAPALDVVDVVQPARKSADHRGLSAGFLAGGSAFVERREAKAREVAQAIAGAQREIARSNVELSARTGSQVVSGQQVAASIEQISDGASQNDDPRVQARGSLEA